MNRKFLAFCATIVVAGAMAVPALAARGEHGERGHGRSRPAQTKMRFKLDAHQWDLGATVTGTVVLRTEKGRGKPLIDAMVRVLVDGHEVGTAVTDVDGKAVVSWGAAIDGDHVMSVVYDGDDIHKRAKRAQGFHVGAGNGDDPEDDLESPTPEPETTLTP